MKTLISIILCSAFLLSCDYSTDVQLLQESSNNTSSDLGTNLDLVNSNFNEAITITPSKWFNNHKAAVSLTYDNPYNDGNMDREIINAVKERGLTLDFEMVTDNFLNSNMQEHIEFFKANLINRGFHIYGHGNKHYNHDILIFSDAYNSFRTCYELMDLWGLNPRAYAYPHGRGYLPTTQLALESAGFICGRGAQNDTSKVFICASEDEPKNWYYLPAVNVGNIDPIQVNNSQEMQEIFLRAITKNAWVIPMYHSIGIPEGYSYYPLEEFIHDLDFLSQNDIWVDNLDQIACYIYERNNFSYDIEMIGESNYEYEVTFNDDLDNVKFNQPLTLELIFNEQLGNIKYLEIYPAVEQKNVLKVENNKVYINVMPNEEKYLIRMIKLEKTIRE